MKSLESDDGTKLEALIVEYEDKFQKLVGVFHLAKRTIWERTLNSAKWHTGDITTRAGLLEEHNRRQKDILDGYNKIWEKLEEEYEEEASRLYLK